MQCKEFKDNIVSLLEPDENTAQMELHMAQCAECEEYYRRTAEHIESVTPGMVPETPGSIKDNVLREIKATGKNGNLRSVSKRVSGIAAGIVVFLITASVAVLSIINLPGEAKAANSTFDKSIAAMGGQRTMNMKLNVRTEGRENFAYIDLGGEMVPHTFNVILAEPLMWRLEKSGRIALFDGIKQYMWITFTNEGFIGDRSACFIEWFGTFLDPKMILLKEKSAAKEKGNKYSMKETATEILLTVKAKAHGNFINDYLLNSSIEESNNRREYVFDKSTNLLKGIRIFVEHEGADILILETTGIEYNVSVDRRLLTTIPDNYKWIDTDVVIASEKFSTISVEEAARLVFEAIGNDTMEDIGEIFAKYDIDGLRKSYGGCKIIKLGKSFESGLYPGKFVPYEILLRNGKVKSYNIALRNDNENKAWIVDGGL